MSTVPAQAIDEAKLNEFMGRFVGDLGAAMSAALVVIGDRLGLYRAMADGEPRHARGARRAHRHRPALRARVAVEPGGGRIRHLRPGQRAFLADARAVVRTRAGGQPGVRPRGLLRRHGAHQGRAQDHRGVPQRRRRRLARAQPRPVQRHRALLPAWLRRASGRPRGSRRSRASQAKLERGALVADVGCGHGASTLFMAEAFPSSEFVGFDYHAASIEEARAAAARGGLAERVRFEVATAKDYPGADYDARGDVRLPARHGRPGRRGRTRARDARRRRHLDDRRAVRRRPPRGQPQPGRARLLRRIDARLHARLARPGGRPRARRAGR